MAYHYLSISSAMKYTTIFYHIMNEFLYLKCVFFPQQYRFLAKKNPRISFFYLILKNICLFTWPKAKVKKPFFPSHNCSSQTLFIFWNVTHSYAYFLYKKKKMQKVGWSQARAPHLFSWMCLGRKSNIGRQAMLFPAAPWAPHVERTWHEAGHPPSEAQQQMDWLRSSLAAKIWKCQNKIKHIGWEKKGKHYVWKWEPEIRINVKRSEIKNVFSFNCSKKNLIHV